MSGYSEKWFEIEAEWSKEPKPESDLEKRVKALQEKQPASRKPKIEVKDIKAPSRTWEACYDI